MHGSLLTFYPTPHYKQYPSQLSYPPRAIYLLSWFSSLLMFTDTFKTLGPCWSSWFTLLKQIVGNLASDSSVLSSQMLDYDLLLSSVRITDVIKMHIIVRHTSVNTDLLPKRIKEHLIADSSNRALKPFWTCDMSIQHCCVQMSLIHDLLCSLIVQLLNTWK